MKIILLIDIKIYLGDRLLWRVFTYNLYIKIVLGFCRRSLHIIKEQKNRYLLDTKNAFFSHNPPDVVIQPKKHNKKI